MIDQWEGVESVSHHMASKGPDHRPPPVYKILPESNRSEPETAQPILRAFLLGGFTLEQADGGSIDVPTSIGRSQSILLFKLLLCHPQRQVARDLLTEIIWPGQSYSIMDGSLGVAKSLLKTGLQALCGQSLLPRVNGDPPGYRLAGQSVLWTDVDACEDVIRRAVATPQAREAVVQWEAAYALLQRGVLLVDDQEAYWYQARLVQDRRKKLAKQRSQCVLRIADLALECGDSNQAIDVLSNEHEANLLHEDIAFHLMELLAQVGRNAEALQCYVRLEAALLERDAEPRTEIQALAHRLRSKATSQMSANRHRLFQQEEMNGSVTEWVNNLRTQDITDELRTEQLTRKWTIVAHEVSHMPIVSKQTTSSFLALPSVTEIRLPDGSSDNNILSRLSNILDEHISVSEQEATYFDQQTQLYWRIREASLLSTNRLYAHVMRHLDDITTFLTHSLSPSTRVCLCETVCRTALLAGILLYDMGWYEQARQHYLVAFQAAAEANNFKLQAVVLGWMSFTWTYAKQYPDALVSVQQARYFGIQTSDTVIQAWLGAVEAEIQAHLQNRDACLQSLNTVEQALGISPSQDISYLVEFTPVLLLGYKGVCLQQLYQKHLPETHAFLREARNALEQALASDAPTKRKLYYLSDLAGVYAREGDVEAACSYVTQTLPVIKHIGTSSKTIRHHLIQTRTLLQPYQDTSYVQKLDEQMMPMFVPQRRDER
jgi:DNA-binding SARP family transcriptional activator